MSIKGIWYCNNIEILAMISYLHKTIKIGWIIWSLLPFAVVFLKLEFLFCVQIVRKQQCFDIFSTFSKFCGLRVRTVAKRHAIFNVYCILYSGFMCQATVIFGITKVGSLVLNTLASWNCFTYKNLFQNGANDMSECLTCETAFCKKAQNLV